MNRVFYLLLFHCFYLPGQAQRNTPVNHKYSIQAGFGAAGSFFVRSYNEGYDQISFLKKDFIGKTFSFGISRAIGKNFDLSLNYSFQEFSRRVSYLALLDNVEFILHDFSIRHINNIYDLTLRKYFGNTSGRWMVGLGLYYLRPIQQEISIYGPGPATVQIHERRHKYHSLNEGGSLVEIGYEKRFQPRMSIGIKSQLMYTLSTQEFESVTLYPYLKYAF